MKYITFFFSFEPVKISRLLDQSPLSPHALKDPIHLLSLICIKNKGKIETKTPKITTIKKSDLKSLIKKKKRTAKGNKLNINKLN